MFFFRSAKEKVKNRGFSVGVPCDASLYGRARMGVDSSSNGENIHLEDGNIHLGWDGIHFVGDKGLLLRKRMSQIQEEFPCEPQQMAPSRRKSTQKRLPSKLKPH